MNVFFWYVRGYKSISSCWTDMKNFLLWIYLDVNALQFYTLRAESAVICVSYNEEESERSDI